MSVQNTPIKHFSQVARIACQQCSEPIGHFLAHLLFATTRLPPLKSAAGEPRARQPEQVFVIDGDSDIVVRSDTALHPDFIIILGSREDNVRLRRRRGRGRRRGWRTDRSIARPQNADDVIHKFYNTLRT